MAINLEITMMSAEERSDKKCVYCGSKAKYKHVVTSCPNNTYKAEFYVCNICQLKRPWEGSREKHLP